MKLSASQLRRELSERNLAIAQGLPHECTCGSVPSVLYQETNGEHGNFLPASYRRICASPDWSRRLIKSYAGVGRLPRYYEQVRRELDCANSSDALLMNIFCYPGVTSRRSVCALLGISPGLRPQFGIKPRLPLRDGRADRTEVDMTLGPLFVEAKLTEGGFERARPDLVLRYQEIESVFDVDELPFSAGGFGCYQLVRGILAAHHCGSSFLLLCDARRADLKEQFFGIVRAVQGCELRSRCALLEWQELSSALPTTIQRFLSTKYGIDPLL
jgi:hypothetical protein